MKRDRSAYWIEYRNRPEVIARRKEARKKQWEEEKKNKELREKERERLRLNKREITRQEEISTLKKNHETSRD